MPPPKDEAQRLYNIFYVSSTNPEPEIRRYNAIENVNICCDELIKLCNFFNDNEGTCFEMDAYYKKVKAEIVTL